MTEEETLYNEVDQLRQDIKRYRSNVEDTGKDLSVRQQLDLLDMYSELTNKLDRLRSINSHS